MFISRLVFWHNDTFLSWSYNLRQRHNRYPLLSPLLKYLKTIQTLGKNTHFILILMTSTLTKDSYKWSKYFERNLKTKLLELTPASCNQMQQNPFNILQKLPWRNKNSGKYLAARKKLGLVRIFGYYFWHFSLGVVRVVILIISIRKNIFCPNFVKLLTFDLSKVLTRMLPTW